MPKFRIAAGEYLSIKSCVERAALTLPIPLITSAKSIPSILPRKVGLSASLTLLTPFIVERNFSMNRNICYGILQAIKQINDDPSLDNVGKLSSTGEYEWRGLCKYLNRFGAVTLLDTLSCDEIKELSYNYLLNQRGLK